MIVWVRSRILAALLSAGCAVFGGEADHPTARGLATAFMNAFEIPISNTEETRKRCIAALQKALKAASELPETTRSQLEAQATPASGDAEQAIVALVKVLNEPHPALFVADWILPRTSVEAEALETLPPGKDDPTGMYRRSDRNRMAEYLLDRGKKSIDEKTKREFARAAILLSAHEGRMLSWLTIIRELRELSKSSDAPAVLGLKEGVIKELRERLDAYNVKDSAYEEKITAIEEAMDRLSTRKHKQWRESDLARAVKCLEEAWPLMPGYPDHGLKFAKVSWWMCNLARDREDDRFLNQILKILEKYKNMAVDENTKRWLGEAMTVKGPPPGKFILKLKLDHGKLVPMEEKEE